MAGVGEGVQSPVGGCGGEAVCGDGVSGVGVVIGRQVGVEGMRVLRLAVCGSCADLPSMTGGVRLRF